MDTQKPDAIELNTPYFLETDDSTVRDGKNNVVFEIYDADIGFNEGELRKMLNALNRYDWLEHQVRSLTAERDKYRDACERLIASYGEKSNWGCAESYNDQHRCGHSSFCTYTAYQGVEDSGYTFARQVKAELEGIEGSEIEVEVE